ncbi:MAG: hypothetical protein XD85_0220 [Parcubacteria bacterium 34_609]|nr:MAG: hypothetical protein XD85_0220 [Parcubacteria bacterium 34_609]
MTPKYNQKNIVSKVASKRVLDQNAAAFKTYDTYKKTADIIERAEFASGKRVSFKSDTGSTLNFEINRYGAYSTTAQKI